VPDGAVSVKRLFSASFVQSFSGLRQKRNTGPLRERQIERRVTGHPFVAAHLQLE